MAYLTKLHTTILSCIIASFLMFIPTHSVFAISIFGNGSDIPDNLISWLLQIILVLLIIKIILIGLVWLSGWLLNESFRLFVTESHEWFSLDAIHNTWDLVLNISNTMFIFSLIYIGIAIIIFGASQYKKTLVSLLITALLVNFSLFFTKIVIDASNIVGSSLYNKIIVDEISDDYIGTFIVKQSQRSALTKDNAATEIPIAPSSGPNPSTSDQLTDTLTDALGLPSTRPSLSVDPIGWVLFKVAEWISDFFSWVVDNIIMFTLNYIFYALVIYVLLFLSFMLIGRYIVLMFLMVTSPIAFASYALPKTKGYIWDPWFKELISQAMVLPALTFFLLFTVRIMKDTSVNDLPIIIRYIIFVSLLFGSIKIAGILSGAVAKYAGKAAGFTTATPLMAAGGIAGKRLANSEWASKNADKGGLRGWAARSTLWSGNKMHAGTWDVRNLPGGDLLGGGGGIKSSYKSMEESRAKTRAGFIQQGQDNISGRKGALKNQKDLIGIENKERKDTLDAEYKKLEADTALSTEERDKRKADLQKKYDTQEASSKERIAKLNRGIARYDTMSDDMFKRLEKSSKQTSMFSLPGTEKGTADAYKAIKNKRTTEAAKEAQETKKVEKYQQEELLTKTIKEYSETNAEALGDVLNKTPLHIVAEVLSKPEYHDKLRDENFAKRIDGKMADRILNNREFQKSASANTVTVMETIRDKHSTMKPEKVQILGLNGQPIQ